MKPRIWLAIIAVLGVSAFWLYFPSPKTDTPPLGGVSTESLAGDVSGAIQEEDAALESGDESAITNYDECVAAGNVPLPDASDKCLTKGGHIFIEGVVEE